MVAAQQTAVLALRSTNVFVKAAINLGTSVAVATINLAGIVLSGLILVCKAAAAAMKPIKDAIAKCPGLAGGIANFINKIFSLHVRDPCAV